jgi:hypothetical protein
MRIDLGPHGAGPQWDYASRIIRRIGALAPASREDRRRFAQ